MCEGSQAFSGYAADMKNMGDKGARGRGKEERKKEKRKRRGKERRIPL
jgi:hypothetical protein